jgi:carbamoyl-phosphate synthase large subunit
MNIQYAIANDRVYILEANPRASRTVPLVSKVCNIAMANIATQVMLGKKLADLDLKQKTFPHFGVKEAVFPFNMFPEVDPVLGPEMRSTGEVLGMADSFGMAFFKAQEATQQRLPSEGTVLISVAEPDKSGVVEAARRFQDLGFRIRATRGTHEYLEKNGIASEPINKLHEGRPHIVDAIKNGEIHLVITTPSGKLSKHDDSYIRKSAVKYKISYITTTAAAVAAAKGIEARRQGDSSVKSLQEYHRDIR